MSHPNASRLSGVLAALLMSLTLSAPALSEEPPKAADPVVQGKEIAFDRKTGNCLACHAIDKGASPGDIGPPLVHMQQRFPDKAKLRAQIEDPSKANPETRMPPFGVHKILSAQEIDLVVEYIHTL